MPFSPQEILTLAGPSQETHELQGIPLHAGMGQGHAVLHFPQLTSQQTVASDLQAEIARFNRALKEMQEAIDQLVEDSAEENARDVLETYRMFAHDKGWLNAIHQDIKAGLTAESAVQNSLNTLSKKMLAHGDLLLRERIVDLEDLSRRLLKYLTGQQDAPLTTHLDGIIVVAKALGPAELLEYGRYGIKGLLLEEGLQTAHVAIVAKAMDIPVISRLSHLMTQVENGDKILLNGKTGKVILRPKEQDFQTFLHKEASWQAKKARAREAEVLPAITQDGVEIDLWLNAGLPADVEPLQRMHAKGVGLYRTEIPFMMSDHLPTVDEQHKLYETIYAKAAGNPVHFRTLDIGGDKILPYVTMQTGGNPAMGWRAIRFGLDRPMLLRHQLRAMMLAAGTRALHIMFPMVAHEDELRRAKEILLLEQTALLQEKRIVPQHIHIGVMLEVPSLVWSLKQILSQVDFVSIGTNDLFQFFFATDRGDVELTHHFDALHPMFLDLLEHITHICRDHHMPLMVCGEMAASPLEALALMGLGIRNLSLSPSAIGEVKHLIRHLHLGNFMDYFQNLRKKPHTSLRHDLQFYAQDHGIIL